MNPSIALFLVPLVSAMPRVQEPAPRPSADPTAIDAELLRALARPDAGVAGRTPALATPFPAVAIRGVVVPKRGEALAVLDVDAALVRVRVGSIVPFADGEHLRVDRIAAGLVVLSRASTGESRSVR